MERETSIPAANRDRLRPMLMTTISLVAGLIPLLIGTGPGSEEHRSIAVLTVGGQTLTLLAVPVWYSLFDNLRQLLQVWLPTAMSRNECSRSQVSHGRWIS
jgi:HAE1 family hydrophobic/amphiphilic exporter-1